MNLLKAYDFLEGKFGSGFKPEVAVVLGSGLDQAAGAIKNSVAVSYKDIPGFAQATVSGHRGLLMAGELCGKKAVILSGRIHFYEGRSMEQAIFPIRVASFLGAKKLILTAAVGSMNPSMKPGDLVIVEDHINFMGVNPLRGLHEPTFGERFPDLSRCYSGRLQTLASGIAKKNKIRAHVGVYFAVSGPAYETPAEIRAFRKLGGDVVGMSLVPEAVAAHQMGMEVLGIGYVANFSAGLSKSVLKHSEVLEAGKKSSQRISVLISETLKAI